MAYTLKASSYVYEPCNLFARIKIGRTDELVSCFVESSILIRSPPPLQNVPPPPPPSATKSDALFLTGNPSSAYKLT